MVKSCYNKEPFNNALERSVNQRGLVNQRRTAAQLGHLTSTLRTGELPKQGRCESFVTFLSLARRH